MLVVGDQNKVQEKSVTTASQLGSLTVIASGLAATDRVIIDGLQRAVPGETVAPENAPPIAAPSDSSSAE